MNAQEIIEFIGGTAAIVAGAVWVIRKLIDRFFNNQSEKFRHDLELKLEEHRSKLSLDVVKASKLHDRRLNTIADTYVQLQKAAEKIELMTSPLKVVIQDAEKEENERIKAATDAFNEFVNLYRQHKIFFRKSTCTIIDNLIEQYRNIYYEYIIPELQKSDLKVKLESAKKTMELLTEKIPPIRERLEKDFRREVGLIIENHE